MIKRTREQWMELFKEFEQSKLLASEFCKEHNICQRYFSKRKIQLGFGGTQKPVAKNLVKLKRAAPKEIVEQSINLHHGGIKIAIPPIQSPEWVASLVKALAQ
ncbi:hypothetical protein OAP14_09385, partial [Aliiglaciecola sp.]|nr:hypothetical protein [Aliiglaciecola sp.]